MGPVAHGLEGPQDAWIMRHQTEQARPLDPPITVTFTPGGLLVQSTQPVWDDPLVSVLGVPDRPPGFIHHLVATDHLNRSILEERFEPHILEYFQAGSRFFLIARAIGFRKSAVSSAAAHRAPSRTGRSSDEGPRTLAPYT